MQDSSKQVCGNCRYLVDLVALGVGLQCSHTKHTKRSKGREVINKLIPSREFTCELFKHSQNR